MSIWVFCGVSVVVVVDMYDGIFLVTTFVRIHRRTYIYLWNFNSIYLLCVVSSVDRVQIYYFNLGRCMYVGGSCVASMRRLIDR